MQSPLRYAVWSAVVAASVAVGAYLKSAPDRVGEATAPKSPAKYVFLAGGSDPYWQLCVAGAKSAAERLGAEVEVRTPKGEGEEGLAEQLAWLGEIGGGSVDGVAVGPIDPARQTTLLNSLAEKTTVVTVDSDAPNSRRMFYVGSSNYEAGEIAARMVREALPEGGKVAVLLASLAKTNAAERNEGFVDALAAAEGDDSPSFEIVGTYLDQGDQTKAKENVRQALEEHSDLGAIVGTFGYHGPMTLEALADVDGGEKIKIIAFDEDERVLAGVASGRVHATVAQDPFMFGFEAIRMLNDVRSGQYLSLPVAGRVDVGVHCIPVDKNNLNDFKARLAERRGAQDAAAK